MLQLRGPTTEDGRKSKIEKPQRLNSVKTINKKIKTKGRESNSYKPNILPKESKFKTFHSHKRLPLQERIKEKTIGENQLFFKAKWCWKKTTFKDSTNM